MEKLAKKITGCIVMLTFLITNIASGAPPESALRPGSTVDASTAEVISADLFKGQSVLSDLASPDAIKDRRIALAIIKPDVSGDSSKNVTPDGKNFSRQDIINFLKDKGFTTVAVFSPRMLQRNEAKELYAEHAKKKFFDSLVNFTCSGESVVIILEGPEDAWKKLRDVLGDMDGTTEGSLRQVFGTQAVHIKYGVTILKNKVHGSDSCAAVLREVPITTRGASIQTFGLDGLDINVSGISSVRVKVDGNKATLTNAKGAKLVIESVKYNGKQYLKVGNVTYLVRRSEIDLSAIDSDSVGNAQLSSFFTVPVVEDYTIYLPTETADKPLTPFPANPILYPSLAPRSPEESFMEGWRSILGNYYRARKDNPKAGYGYGGISKLMYMAALLGIHGNWKDYYLAQDVLNDALQDPRYGNYKMQIIRLLDFLLLSRVGCNWQKWDSLIAKRKADIADAKTRAREAEHKERAKSFFEKKVEASRLAVRDIDNWEIIDAKALTGDECPDVPTGPEDEAVRLGAESVKNARVLSVPFFGGAATKVKTLIGANKMVHMALKVKLAKKDGGKVPGRHWISIGQARIGFILGQNPSSKIAVATGIGGTIEGESDRSTRILLDKYFPGQVNSRQIKVAMQRAGLVLGPDGEPLRYKDGRLVICAENHLWSLLSALTDKDYMIDALETTDGIVTTGNGDNPLNYAREGMVGEILKAREHGIPLATVAIGTPSAGDVKGGLMVMVTYRNKLTKEIIKQKEIREISEFPTRLLHEVEDKKTGKKKMVPVYSTKIDISQEKDTEFYQKCVAKNWFIEDMLKDKTVAFNQAFYAIDLCLIIARAFGLNEHDQNLIEKLKVVDKQLWVGRITELGEKVYKTIQLEKGVPNENGLETPIGYMTEQAVQDLIVNGLGLLSVEGLPMPKAEMMSIPRKDGFAPYKGDIQNVYDDEGHIIATVESGDERAKYDLVANQELIRGALRRLREKGHNLVIGDYIVTDIIPVTLKEIINANKQAKQVAAKSSSADGVKVRLGPEPKDTYELNTQAVVFNELLSEELNGIVGAKSKFNIPTINEKIKNVIDKIRTYVYITPTVSIADTGALGVLVKYNDLLMLAVITFDKSGRPNRRGIIRDHNAMFYFIPKPESIAYPEWFLSPQAEYWKKYAAQAGLELPRPSPGPVASAVTEEAETKREIILAVSISA